MCLVSLAGHVPPRGHRAGRLAVRDQGDLELCPALHRLTVPQTVQLLNVMHLGVQREGGGKYVGMIVKLRT